MPRTKATESPTRDKLLEAGDEIMRAKGYVAATVDEICAAAGVTKGSFFHYFKSKEDLGKVLIERFAANQAAGFQQAQAGVDDPLERVYRALDFADEAFRTGEIRGCLVGTLAQEIWLTHPDLRDACRFGFSRFIESMKHDLVEAKRLHAPAADFDPEGLSAYLLATIQGSMLLYKTHGDREMMLANVGYLKSHLRSLYGR